MKATFFNTAPVFAPDEERFQESLKELFTPLGYDATRFMLMLNGNFQRVKYANFALLLNGNCVVPISRKYYCLPGFDVRVAQVMDMSKNQAYYASYTSHVPSVAPKFSQHFLQLCDKHAAQFNDPLLILSEAQILTMCLQFRIDSKTNIKRRELCAMLQYYVNHRNEFHDPLKSSMDAVMVKFKNPNDHNLTFRSVAFNGSVDELKIIIQFNNTALDAIIDINASGASKMTALHQAVRSQSIDKINLLLTPDVLKGQKIDLDGFSKEGKTPLHLAWDKATRNLQIFEALLKAGAKPDVTCEACPDSLIQTLMSSNDPEAHQFLEVITQFHAPINCN